MLSKLRTYTFLHKYDMLKRGSILAFKQLLDNQSMSPDALERLHWEKLRQLLTKAISHCPFYRDFYREVGWKPNDELDQAIFESFPVLTREHLREHGCSILDERRSPESCNVVATGGSTGEPVKVLHPREIPRAAALWRMMSWWGVAPGSILATIYREPSGNWRKRFGELLVWWPGRRILLDATHLTADSILEWVHQCQRSRPPIVHGYVGGLSHVASVLLDKGLELPGVRAVWATSAPLSPDQRALISKAFDAPVFDQYGSCEVFYLAAETPFVDGLAVSHDLRRLEVVDDGGHAAACGLEGRLLVTDLENHAFPLIRYEIGDRGSYRGNQPRWKLPFPLMNPVRGRVSDLFSFPGGVSVSGEFWTTLFDDEPDAVRRFQVVRRKDTSLLIRYVSGGTPETPAAVERVAARVRSLLGNEVPVAIQQVERIPDNAGKLRYIISE